MKRFFRFPVGAFACTSLLDGGKTYSLKELFSNAPEDAVRAALESRGILPDDLFIPYTHLHVDTGDRQILVDTGAGKLFPTAGLLQQSMTDAELDPAEIDTVIITHAHPDHIGGMMTANGSPAYPNATYIIAKQEWSYWFSDKASGQEGEYAWFADVARKNLEPVRDRVRLVDFVSSKATLFPGVSLVTAPGHTPGHAVVALESGGTELLYIGDAVITPLHLEHPDWRPIFDIEPERAAASKQSIFDLAAQRGSWVIGQHFFPFPSLGRVQRAPDGWTWRPIDAAKEGGQ